METHIMDSLAQALMRRLVASRLVGALSSVNFIEADVLLSPAGVPIMAHPPALDSDLDFASFVEASLAHNRTASNPRIGVKLDFKDPGAVPLCLGILEEAGFGRSGIPLMLNADVWRG